MTSTAKQLVGWGREGIDYTSYLAKRALLSRKYKSIKSDALYFLHIPKTAGTTLTSFIDTHFEPSQILREQLWDQLLPTYSHKDLVDPAATPLSDYKFMRGHFGFGLYREIGAMPKVITMLREPVDRTLSQFYHVKRDPIFSWFRANLVLPDESAEVFFKDENRAKLLCNVATKYLAHNVDFKHIAIRARYDLAGLLFDSSSALNINAEQTDEWVNTANGRLQSFAFVGIQEYFQESVTMLCHRMNWMQVLIKDRKMYFKSNPGPDSLDFSTHQHIRKLNMADTAIYDSAKVRFESEYAELCSSVLGETISRADFIRDRKEVNKKLYSYIKPRAI